MKIALDFDETYTEDPVLFGNLVRLAKARGHEVKIVTWRQDVGPNNIANDDIKQAASDMGIGVIFCNGIAKMKCYAADVWIDDSPYAVTCHAKWANTQGVD